MRCRIVYGSDVEENCGGTVDDSSIRVLARALVSAVVLACIDFRLNILAGTASVVVVASN